MKTELENIGAWGRMHYDFLYRSNRTVINVMRLNGTLNNYLADIDRDACDMFDSLEFSVQRVLGIFPNKCRTSGCIWISQCVAC